MVLNRGLLDITRESCASGDSGGRKSSKKAEGGYAPILPPCLNRNLYLDSQGELARAAGKEHRESPHQYRFTAPAGAFPRIGVSTSAYQCLYTMLSIPAYSLLLPYYYFRCLCLQWHDHLAASLNGKGAVFLSHVKTYGLSP